MSIPSILFVVLLVIVIVIIFEVFTVVSFLKRKIVRIMIAKISRIISNKTNQNFPFRIILQLKEIDHFSSSKLLIVLHTIYLVDQLRFQLCFRSVLETNIKIEMILNRFFEEFMLQILPLSSIFASLFQESYD
jgi:hypothetical protein